MNQPLTTTRNWAEWPPFLKIMGARVVVLAVVLASLIAVSDHGEASHYFPFYLFMLVALVTTMIYAYGVRSQRTANDSVIYQFAVDPLIVMGMIYFTGGIDSQLYLLFPLLILAAGITVSGPHVLHVTILSVVLYSLLIVALYLGVLTLPGQVSPRILSGVDIFQILLFRNLIFIMVGGATTYFTGSLTRQQATIKRIGTVASSILENVGTPLLAVDANGMVVSVNPSAASLVGQRREALRGRPLETFFEGEAPCLSSRGKNTKVWQVKRKDKPAFPAFCAVSKGKLPSLTGSSDDLGDGGVMDIYLVTLVDLSDSVKGDTVEDHRERVEVVNEIAHVVRNPLTAIRGAGELLSSAVDEVFASGSGQLTSEDWETIKRMSNLIFEQSMELDDKVNDFLESVGEGSTRVEEALKNARKWSQKLKNNMEIG